MHGPVTFVPIDLDRFKAGILDQVMENKRINLGRVFRHPNALDCEPYYQDFVSPMRYSYIVLLYSDNNYFSFCRIKAALDVLVQNHGAYGDVADLAVDDNEGVSLLELTMSEDVNINAQLGSVDNLQELEKIFKALWCKKDKADEEDI